MKDSLTDICKEDYEKIIICLHLLGNFFKPIDKLFNDLNGEVIRFIDDPFDTKKIIKISEQRLFYENFGNNPLHAWEAIRLCQQYQFSEQPIWAYNAVFKSAEAVTQLSSAEGTVDSAIKNAFGIDGHKISQFDDNIFWLNVVHEIKDLTNSGISQKEAFLRMAKKYEGRAGSEDNVEKRYFTIGKLLDGVVLPRPFGP